ncbi:MAG: response regulator [Candidatus Nealsonbacteria bacterium]|nr:response regulator [Candidatus Nealsonbacteria bacterium]
MDSLRVLLIEDSATSRVLVQGFLQAAGMETFVAEDGTTGTAMLREHQVDVVVLDVVLPDADGVELCRVWHRDPDLKDVPVLLISGERLADEDRAAGLRSGAMGYLLKPFSDTELLAQVHLLHQLGQTHRQLKDRNVELEHSNRELEEFAYIVSHDLKEPLRTITGHCRMLTKCLLSRLDEQTEAFLAAIAGGAERMQKLVDDLLAYSRVGRADRPSETVDLNDLLARVLANLGAAVDESGATVHVDDLPNVWANRLMLGQLFQNLLSNALKFRSERPPAINVSCEPPAAKDAVPPADDRVTITVADNGIGIDPRHFEWIFGIFQQAPTEKKYPGTGMGLALCRKIVTNHDGRLWIESELGKGTTFHVELPVHT